MGEDQDPNENRGRDERLAPARPLRHISEGERRQHRRVDLEHRPQCQEYETPTKAPRQDGEQRRGGRERRERIETLERAVQRRGAEAEEARAGESSRARASCAVTAATENQAIAINTAQAFP